MPSSTSPSPRLARRARLAAVLLTVACTLVTTVPVGHAAATESPGSPPTTAADRQQLEEDLAEATADELRLGQELAAAEAERARLVGLLADVEARLAAAVQALRDGEAELGRA